MNRAVIIKPDGTETILDHRPTYDEVSKAVGGYIEYTQGRDETGKMVTIIVNEEGLLERLSYNDIVNRMRERLHGESYLVGTAVVLWGWRTTAGS